MAVTYTEKLVAAMKKGLRRVWCNNGFKTGRAEKRTGIGKKVFSYFSRYSDCIY